MLLNSRSQEFHTAYGVGIALLGAVLGGAAVVIAWYFGPTSPSAFAVFHFFPVSDALGYHGCATSIATTGHLDESFGANWCARRLLYPTMLASLLSATAFSSQLALILEGSLVGLAIAVFCLQVRPLVGTLGVLLTAILLFAFVSEFTIGYFVTEVAGFSLGLFGITLLIFFSETKRAPCLFAGAAILSVGLTARAGAMFVLPAIVIWSLLLARTSRRQSLAFLTASITGIMVGPLLQFALAIFFGTDPSHSGASFSTTLYGLSTGSRDWTEAYRHFDADFKLDEKIAFQHIYTAAFHNILETPGVFATSLLEAARVYWLHLFEFGVIEYLDPIFTALAALGVVRCVIGLRYPWASLLLILAAAEVLAAPLIIGRGDIRVFAATVSLRFLFAGLGLHLVISEVGRALRRTSESVQSKLGHGRAPVIVASVASGMVLLMMIAPTISMRPLSTAQAAAKTSCPAGLKEVISRFGNESQMFTITNRSTTIESLQPFRVGWQRLLQDEGLESSWLGPYLLGLKPPLTFVRAVDYSPGTYGSIKKLVFAGELQPSDDLQSLCVDPIEHVDFANAKHYVIKRIQPTGTR